MNRPLLLAIWNANGLIQHRYEVEVFLADKNIDIMLISETHLTDKCYVKIPKYDLYHTNHPAGTARGGTAILIKNNIAHMVHGNTKNYNLQSTAITVTDGKSSLVIASVYCTPNQSIKSVEYQRYFKSLGPRFIAGGDYNAKHPQWGSRLITPRGRELLKAMQVNKLFHVSTGQPTYWPSDPNKTPDLIDFCICKGVSKNQVSIDTCLDLSSDHSPLLLTINSCFQKKEMAPKLHNKMTNWEYFKELVEDTLCLNIPLKSNSDLDTAVEIFNNCIQRAAWTATPEIKHTHAEAHINDHVKILISEKRKLRRIWQSTRNRNDKKKLNKLTKQLKNTIRDAKNSELHEYLSNLSPTEATDYSLWKATKKISQPTPHNAAIKTCNGDWAKTDKQKAIEFAKHLSNVFQPFPSQSAEVDLEVNEFLSAPFQMDFPTVRFTWKEVRYAATKTLKTKKAPGYDLITSKVLKELPKCGYKFLTIIFNAMIKQEYFPTQWKVAEIILIQKPGKTPSVVSNYRPISLLPVASKLFEKLLLKRINPIIAQRNLIPAHQFGFRKYHSTIEQVNCVYDFARQALERRQFCTAAFLDITQAFDKVWHEGLLYKLKQGLPHNCYMLLKSYLQNRHFLVKVNNETTNLHAIRAGVPQGSVLGPVLYTLFTADLPLSKNTYTATYADDTVVMARSTLPSIASDYLQENLNSVSGWMKKWRIKANESKSTQITFTLRNGSCPAVSLNSVPIPQTDNAKYLGILLDRRLTWRSHIFLKRKQLGLKLRSLHWLIGYNSALTLDNKVLIYKAILKPIWTYGVQLWGSAAKSNLEIMQRFQSKVLRMCANAPWFVRNEILHRDLKVTTVFEEINNLSQRYNNRLATHPNNRANNLSKISYSSRLKKCQPNDLMQRFKP